MKAAEANLLEILEEALQFVVPIYQRTYSWTEKECRQLWDDILKAGRDNSVHFTGSIVYLVEEENAPVTCKSPFLLIDGQQRLTTVSLLLAALSEALGNNELMDGCSAQQISTNYLVNCKENDEHYYKLLLSQTDKESLKAIVRDAPEPSETSIRIRENFESFKKWIKKEASGNLSEVWNGINKLVVVDISLSRKDDNPQLIFESMNSTGRELSQADLIRNFVLMDLAPKLQTKLYDHYWRPMEEDFGQEPYSTHFDRFIRHYLTVKAKTGDIPRLREVYETFKQYAAKDGVGGANREIIVKDLREYAKYYCAMALNKEEDDSLKQAFQDLRELKKVDTAYPLLLELYCDYINKDLSRDDFHSILRMIETYVFRRAICEIPTNSLNKTFSIFGRSIKKDRYLESVKAHFLDLPSYRRFPNDEEFAHAFQSRDLYNFRSQSYWLRRFENFGRKEQAIIDNYTIEHIMPQNPDMSPAWKAELGEEWERVHKEYLHTLGNLTLTGYNSKYSDKPFKEKRDMDDGFGESPLRVNKDLGKVEKWDESAIKARASRLSEVALTVWPSPKLPQEMLEVYQARQVPDTKYSIGDHKHLRGGSSLELFEDFRREVKALNPCVTEEFLKLYVAFKAETNFVDVVAKKNGLDLFLNLPFADIIDPHGICTDVTNVGHYGNGDGKVRLEEPERLPYIIGLVRQALERQLGHEETA